MPAAFDRCRAKGGRVRTISGPDDEWGLGEDEYMRICVLGGKVYPGHRATKKSEHVVVVPDEVLAEVEAELYAGNQRRHPRGAPGGKGGEFAPKGGQLSGADKEEVLAAVDDWQLGMSKFVKMRRDPSGEFAQVLDKVPNYKGEVYRGLGLSKKDVAQLKEGRQYKMSLHSSASKTESVSRPFAQLSYEMSNQTPILLQVRVKRAADISTFVKGQNRYQKEVVLMKGTKYRIDSVKPYKFPRYKDAGMEMEAVEGLRVVMTQVS